MNKPIAPKDCPPVPQRFTDVLETFVNSCEREDAAKAVEDAPESRPAQPTETTAVLAKR